MLLFFYALCNTVFIFLTLLLYKYMWLVSYFMCYKFICCIYFFILCICILSEMTNKDVQSLCLELNSPIRAIYAGNLPNPQNKGSVMRRIADVFAISLHKGLSKVLIYRWFDNHKRLQDMTLMGHNKFQICLWGYYVRDVMSWQPIWHVSFTCRITCLENVCKCICFHRIFASDFRMKHLCKTGVCVKDKYIRYLPKVSEWHVYFIGVLQIKLSLIWISFHIDSQMCQDFYLIKEFIKNISREEYLSFFHVKKISTLTQAHQKYNSLHVFLVLMCEYEMKIWYAKYHCHVIDHCPVIDLCEITGHRFYM